MTSLGFISSHLLPVCLFVLLIIKPAICKKRTKDNVPPTVTDINGCKCIWTDWMNNDDYDKNIGDDTTYNNLRQLYRFCDKPKNIKCRDKFRWHVPFHSLYLRNTICNVTTGLKCVSVPHEEDSPYYCPDFEITVQCCHCGEENKIEFTKYATKSTTTKKVEATVPTILDDQRMASAGIPETTVAMTKQTLEKPGEMVVAIHDDGHGMFAGDTEWTDKESNKTLTESKSTSGEEETVPLAVILVIVFGCLVLFAFSIIIWMIMTKGFFIPSRKRYPHQEYYQEAPMEIIRTPIKVPENRPEKHKVAFARTNMSSSSDYVTSSSDDEGYRSRPSNNRKRKKRRLPRDRNANNANNRADYTSDSFEFPTLDSRSPAEENSDEGRLRKWFPDEYERSQQQKRQQQQNTKSKLPFNTPFNANNRKSIQYMDGES